MDALRRPSPADWISELMPAAKEAGRALGQLPDGAWGEALTAVVDLYGHPRSITSFQIMLDASGNRGCPEALNDEVFLREISGEPVYMFGEEWAEERLPPGVTREVDLPWNADRPWDKAVHHLAHVVAGAFESGITASARRLVESPPLLARTNAPPPKPQPFGVSHEGAELVIAEWMRHLGEGGARVTRASGDGGVDVRSPRYVAQVKHYAGNVGVEPIRELAGVATVEGKGALFFASKGYAPGSDRLRGSCRRGTVRIQRGGETTFWRERSGPNASISRPGLTRPTGALASETAQPPSGNS